MPTITAIGEGSVEVRPDRALIVVGATIQAATADEAQRQVAERIARVRERASRLGLRDEHVSHGGYEIHPAHLPGKPSPYGAYGYQVSQQLVLTFPDVDRVGAVLDELVGRDGATTASVRFSLGEPEAAEAEARRRAVEKARAKAEALAAAAGVRLGRLLALGDPRPGWSAVDMWVAQAAGPTDIPVSNLRVVARVEMSFAIDAG